MTTIPHSPHSPKQVSWEEKARAWGVDLFQPAEAERVEGPVASVEQRYHDERACSGSFRFTDRDGPMWEAICDQCGARVTVPARREDPQIRQQARMGAAGLPRTFAGKRFERDEENAWVLSQLRVWLSSCAGIQKAEDRRRALLPAPCLWGDPGRGKTHLAVKVAEQVIRELDLAVAFYSVRGLLRELQRFDDEVQVTRAWERASTVDVLILDDLGAERPTDWRLDQLADLIDTRYSQERPIVVATNFDPAGWEMVLDDRSISRLRAMTFSLELKGPDRRLTATEEVA